MSPKRKKGDAECVMPDRSHFSADELLSPEEELTVDRALPSKELAVDHALPPQKPTDGQAESAEELTDEAFAEQVNQMSARSIRVTLAIAYLCVRKTNFTTEKKTLRKAGLSTAKYSKLRQIGLSPRFKDRSLMDQLPPNAGYTLLYALCQLSDKQMAEALTDRTISTSVTRAQIENIRDGKPAKAPRIRKSRKPFAIVTAPQNLDSEIKKLFREKLVELCDQYGAKLDATMAPGISSLAQQETTPPSSAAAVNGLTEIAPMVSAAAVPDFNETEQPAGGR